MALRYVARRIGVPALRRASGPRVSPSAGSGPLASRSSKARYSNGNAGQEQHSEDIMEEVAKQTAAFQATADAIKEARRLKKIEWRMYKVSAAIGLGLGVYAVVAVSREARAIVREQILAREAREAREMEEMAFMGGYADEADMVEADMEKDTGK